MRGWHAYLGLETTVKNMLTSLRAVGELQNSAIRVSWEATVYSWQSAGSLLKAVSSKSHYDNLVGNLFHKQYVFRNISVREAILEKKICFDLDIV